MLIRSLPRGLFILLVFCGQEVCAQESPEEPFYQQIIRGVIRLKEHQSICAPGRDWSVERNITIGTGFFVQDRLPGTANKGASRFFLVTARHVVENRADIFARVATGESGHDEAVLLLPRGLWVFHPGPNPEGTFPIDVAVMRVEYRDFMKAFLHCTEEENPEGCGESESTGKPLVNQLNNPPSVMERAIFFGFPESDITKDALEPFARAGVVAYTERNAEFRIGGGRVADPDMYLVDAPAFGGNSGGPVLREPLPFLSDVELRGLVTGGHVGGRDYAIITSVTRIRETLVNARSRAGRNTDGWQTVVPTLPIRCTPDKKNPQELRERKTGSE